MVAPLAGFKVIELGTMITAPLAGMMLGDLGAEVVKVERKDGGDPFRSFNGSRYSPHFVAFNRNKSSILLDLQSEPEREELVKLLASADVLIDNFRPGVLERLGLTRKKLEQINPKIIHCSITGFGGSGPYRDRPAYDTVGQALSGIAGLSINPDAPRFSGTTISDNVTGMYACYAILAALVERQAAGRGRRIEINMLEASVAFMPDAFMNREMLGLTNDPFTRVSFSQAYVVRCLDEQFLAIHLSSPEKFWKGLLTVLGAPELAQDARFAERGDRIKNYLQLADELQIRFARESRSHWVHLLVQNDVPFAPVHKIDDVFVDPQLEALGSFRPMMLPNGAVVRCIQAPILFDGERLTAWAAAPAYPDPDTSRSTPHSDVSRSVTGSRSEH